MREVSLIFPLFLILCSLFKNNPILEEHALKVLNAELDWRRKENRLWLTTIVSYAFFQPLLGTVKTKTQPLS